MSDIDFQNGLVVGLTLGGKNGLIGPLPSSGESTLQEISFIFVAPNTQFTNYTESSIPSP